MIRQRDARLQSAGRRYGRNDHRQRRQSHRHGRPRRSIRCLGPLADNGGPTIDSRAVGRQPGDQSRAISAAVAGVGGVPEFDQRGTPFGRVFGGRIDIGAFEYQAAERSQSRRRHARGRIGRQLLARATSRSAKRSLLGQHVSRAPTRSDSPRHCCAAGTILLTMGELKITDSTSIEGLGANLLTIDASGNDPTPDSTSRRRRTTATAAACSTSMTAISSRLKCLISGLTLTGGATLRAARRRRSRPRKSHVDRAVVDLPATRTRKRSGTRVAAATFTAAAWPSNGSTNSLTDSKHSMISGKLRIQVSSSGGGIRKRFRSLGDEQHDQRQRQLEAEGGHIGQGRSPSTVTTARSAAIGRRAGAATLRWRRRTQPVQATITYSTISGNSAGVTGRGEAFSVNCVVTVVGSTISGNMAWWQRRRNSSPIGRFGSCR